MPARPALITVMTRAAESAARVLRRDFFEVENLQISTKSPSNFVTAADKRSEDVIRKELEKARPDFGYIMEEGGVVPGQDLTKNFIIDPIDGTNNFIHAIPHWAIAIAAQEAGEITAAVTYDVCKDEFFWAYKGGGAWLGERKLRVSARKELSNAMVASGSPSRGRGDMEKFRRETDSVLSKVAGFRRLGAASIELAYVAAGRIDAYWEEPLNIWDIAGGLLMVQEAGGKFTTPDGQGDVLASGRLLATNGHIHQSMVEALNP